MPSDAELLRTLGAPDSDPEEARRALRALGRAVELDRFEALLHDAAILRHPAAGVRRDAACALGALGTRRLDALIALLEDADLTVARAAWLSLWILTGKPYGLDEAGQFRALPVQLAQPEDLRDELFTRTGVTAAQRVAAEAMLRDDIRRADAARRFRALRDEATGTEGQAWPTWKP